MKAHSTPIGIDPVQGAAGDDLLEFLGSAVNEAITVSASGSQGRIPRDVGSVLVNLGGIERLQLLAAGGADIVTATTSPRPRSGPSTSIWARATCKATSSASPTSRTSSR